MLAFRLRPCHRLSSTRNRRPWSARVAACVALTGTLALAAGCPAPDGAEDPMEAQDDDTGEPVEATTTGEAPVDDPSTSGGEMAEETGDTGCNFICPDTEDTGGVPQCDAWSQDCPEGEKCTPWANDGGPAWNSLRCTPLAENPGQEGDDCLVEGSGVSGIDDCGIGLFCWNADESGQGTCVQQCTGSAEAPICDNPDNSCVIANDGVLTLCLPECDPLVQDCAEGEACYGAGDAFACVPDASGEDAGDYGDPCEFTNACDPGLFCGSAEVVPECAGSAGCCSEFCDLGGPEPDAQCSGSGLGQVCEPWYAEGQAPPGGDLIGACVVPT